MSARANPTFALRPYLPQDTPMFNILQRPPEITDRPDAKPLAVRAGSIRFENVRFAYEAARPILNGVTFEVPVGKTVAIVGPSGAGKSTISRLLFRFYDVTSGRILVDGQDIRDVTQTSLRAAIGMAESASMSLIASRKAQ